MGALRTHFQGSGSSAVGTDESALGSAGAAWLVRQASGAKAANYGSKTLLQVNGSLFCLFGLAGVNLLLPIERGFPPLTFLGPPITVATVISLLGLMVAIFAMPALVLTSLRDRYLQFQALFLVMMVLGLSRSSEPSTAAAMCLIYFSTFISRTAPPAGASCRA